MSDAPSGQVPPNGAADSGAHRAPFPGVRLLYAIGFAIVAWFVFWITLLLALVQFVVIAVNGHANDELLKFSRALTQYLSELLGYITFVHDTQPFPIGPFPKG